MITTKLSAAISALVESQKQWGAATTNVFSKCIEVGNQLHAVKAALRSETRAIYDRGMPRKKGKEWTDVFSEITEKFGLSEYRLRQFMRLSLIAKADPSILDNASTIREAMRLAGILPEGGSVVVRETLALPEQAENFMEKFAGFWERSITLVPAELRASTAARLRSIAAELDAA